MLYLTELVNGSMGLKHNVTYVTLHKNQDKHDATPKQSCIFLGNDLHLTYCPSLVTPLAYNIPTHIAIETIPFRFCFCLRTVSNGVLPDTTVPDF